MLFYLSSQCHHGPRHALAEPQSLHLALAQFRRFPRPSTSVPCPPLHTGPLPRLPGCSSTEVCASGWRFLTLYPPSRLQKCINSPHLSDCVKPCPTAAQPTPSGASTPPLPSAITTPLSGGRHKSHGRSQRRRPGLHNRPPPGGPRQPPWQASPAPRGRDSVPVHQGPRDLHLSTHPA